MSLKDEITKAIGAHGLWKARLKEAIETGKCAQCASNVDDPTACDFGKWYAQHSATPELRTPAAKDIGAMHTEFHKTAAEVLRLASTGKKAEAFQLLNSDGAFSRVSSRLTQAMMALRQSLQ